MKRIYTSLLVALMALLGLPVTAQTVTTYDFEDGNAMFTADSRISVTVVEGKQTIYSTDFTPDGKAVKFTGAGNAQNGYSFAHFDFSSLCNQAAKVKVEFEAVLGNGARSRISIGDASVRGNGSAICSKTTYGAKGAIFMIGTEKSVGYLNGTNNSGLLTGLTQKWLKVTVEVDELTKTYTYSIVDKETGAVLYDNGETPISFWQSDATNCTQIDMFGYINNAQMGLIDNLVITVTKDERQQASYTVNFLDKDSQPIKEAVTRNGAVGDPITLLPADKDPLWNAEGTQKYIYQSDDTEGLTIAEDGSTVVNITYRDAAVYNYTVVSNLGANLASGTGFEGENLRVGYPRYQLVDNNLYMANVDNKEYRTTVSLTADNVSKTVNYTLQEGKVAVFYTEAENIEGITIATNDNIPVRASGAVAATTAEDILITNIPNGKYKFHVGIFTSKSSYNGFAVNFGIGTETFAAAFSAVNLNEVVSEEYELNSASTPIKYLASSSADTQFDYIWIEKTGDAELAFDPATAIANADFEADEPIANKVCTYAKDVQEGQVANMQPLTGWTIVENGDARAAGTFAYGSTAILGGDGGNVPAVGPNGETEGKALGIEAVWSATTQYTQEITLPAGEYLFEAVIYNAAGTGALTSNLIGVDGNYLTTKNYPVGKWTKDQVKFTLDEEKNVTVSLGVNSGNVGNGTAPHLFIDYIKLYGSDEIAAQELAAAIEDYNNALAAANEAAANEVVTGEEKTTLNEAIAANSNIDMTSVEAVKAATAVLNAAVETFNAAIPAYQALADANAMIVDLPYADSEKKPEAKTATNAADAATAAQEVLVSLRPYYESNAIAEGVEGAEVISDKIVNADASDGNNGWTINGNMNNPRNTESWTDANGKNDYMYFDGGNWNANSWDVNFSQDITLTAGKYVLSAIMRASTNVDLKLFAGTDSVKAKVIGSAGNVFDRGWNYSFVTFEVPAESTVNIGVRGIANNSHEWMSFSNFRLVRIEKPATPEFEPAYGTLWTEADGSSVDENEFNFITLENKYFKDFVKAGDTIKVAISHVGNQPASSRPRVITEGTLILTIDNTGETKTIQQGTTSANLILTEDEIAKIQEGADVVLSWKYLTVAQVDLVEKKAEIDPTLLAEAEGLASDASAVAVGKLLAAIEAYKKDAKAEALQAAMNQFKADNADQEADQTAKVATNGWKKYDGSNAGVCATQFAPAIDTYDGRKNVQLAEVYEQTVETTGTIIYQDITGLQNGSYKVGFYGNAFFTSGRGFDSPMADGAEDVAYVFANDQKAFITAHIATSTTENDFRQFDVEVTDGTIKLGMGKEKAGTNWHTMQIYQLTWFTTAKEVYAALKTDMQALIADAKAMTGVKEKEAFETALNKAEAALESNMLNITEFEAEITALKEAMKAFKLANLIIAEGKYYLSAIELEDNNIMAAGNAWGTHGIVNGEGLDLNFIYNYDADNYNIETNIYNGSNHYLGSDLYMDAPAFGWKIEEATTGIGFNIYAMFDGVKKYISVASDGNLTLSETAYAWGFIHESNWVAIMEIALKEALEKATPENPVDATLLLKDANFNRNDHRWEAWTVSEDCTNKNLGGGCSGTNGNGCAESYHSTFTISQTINDAPKGTYKLEAQGFYRQDNEVIENAPVFFINNETVEVPVKTGEEDGMSAASESFTAGSYNCEPITVFVEDGTLTVGVQGTGVNQWVVFDNFRLTYYGTANTVGITEVNNNVENNVKTIYNLRGQKVEKAQKGLYIINGKKVVLK